MNKLHVVAIAILVLVILAMGVLIFQQQRDIGQLKAQVFGGKSTPNIAENNQKSAIPDPESQKYFSGEIKAISESSLDVEAKLSKFKDPNKMKTGQAVILRPEDYVNTKKMIKVALNSKTQYLEIRKEELKVGDILFVTADNFPSKVESLTALKIAKVAIPNNAASQ